ncbi:MAG: CDP-alcohol phosphatidyltransferase family protein [Sandaracinaceae bacterium]
MTPEDVAREGTAHEGVAPEAVPPEDVGRLVANALSLSRVPLAALLWVAPASPLWVLSLLGVAGLTDLADGWVMRRWAARRWAAHHRGAFAASVARGAALDGFADKVFVASAVSVLYFVHEPPLWIVVALMTRELLLAPLMVLYRLAPASQRSRVDFTAGVPGKAATLAQFCALILGFVGHPLLGEMALGVSFLGAVSVLHYVVRAYMPKLFNGPDRAT